jgi:four helix bundle protein
MRLKLPEFIAYQKSVGFTRSVTALLDRPAFVKDYKLRDQISDAVDSITANLREGYEQPTDRMFSNYVYHSKGSAGETVARLQRAREKGHITEQELAQHVELGEEVCRLLGGLARYLYMSDFKDRGRHDLTRGRSPDAPANQHDQTNTAAADKAPKGPKSRTFECDIDER